ncbi:MAG TPA: PQQ-dependent sugar dehydrogenase, partial [Planctomycetota bacterium]
MKLPLLLLALPLLLPAGAAAQTLRSDEHAFRVVRLVEGLDHPWSLAFLPDGRMLVTERPGRLRTIVDGKLADKPIEGLPQVEQYGQGGLHDVVPHPQFEKNQLLYLAYAARGADGVGTELARGKLVDNRLEGVQVLFRQSPKGNAGQHFGGRIVFDRDGYVYLTLGDRGERDRAQRPDDH